MNGFGSAGRGGARHTPGGAGPVPNSVPAGSKTGAPPRTEFYSRTVTPGVDPTQIVMGAPPNRTVVLVAPLVGFTVYIGNSGVSASRGLALSPGIPYYAQLVGLQDLFAVTDSPIALPLQVQVSIVLMAEQERSTV